MIGAGGQSMSAVPPIALEQRRRHSKAEAAGPLGVVTSSNFVACMTGRNAIFGDQIFDPRPMGDAPRAPAYRHDR